MSSNSKYEELSYTLEESEIIDGMKISGVYRKNGKKSIIQMAVLLLVFGLFLVSFVMSGEFYNILLALFSLLIIAVVYFLPILDMKRHAKKGEKNVKIRVYQDKVYYYPKGETKIIELQGENYAVYSKEKSVISVVIKTGGILIIPTRVISPEKIDRVLELLGAS